MESKKYIDKEDYVHSMTLRERMGHIYHLILLENLEYVLDKKVLHLGCNAGTTSKLLSFYADEVISVDINEKAISEAKKQDIAETNIEYICADFLNINPSVFLKSHNVENGFDCIILFDTLEHIYEEDNEKLSHLLFDLCSQKGHLLLFSPSTKDKSAHDKCHVQYFNLISDVSSIFSNSFIIIKSYNEIRSNPKNKIESHNSFFLVLKKVSKD